MTQKLANKTFSVKSTQIMHLEHHKERNLDSQTRYAAASVVADRQKDYHNPRACANSHSSE